MIYELFFIGFVILIGFIGHLFFQKTKIPELLFMIVFGLLIGPVSGSLLGEPVVPVEPFRNIMGLVTTIALIIILLNSGFDFDILEFAKIFSRTTFFAVTTFVLTIVLVSLFMVTVVGWPILTALLIGAVSSGTTTITVFHLVKPLEMVRDVKRLLVLESIINDVTIITGAVIITRLIKAEAVTETMFTLQDAVSTLFGGILIAVVGGIVFFVIWLRTLDFLKTSHLKFAYTLGLLFVLYDGIEFLNSFGPIAVMVFSIMVGNTGTLITMAEGMSSSLGGDPDTLMKKLGIHADIQEQSDAAVKSIKAVLDDVSFFVKTFFFVSLGILFDPSVVNGEIIGILAGILVLMVASRYISSRILAFRYHEFSPYSKIIAVMLPRGFTATVVAFLPGEQGVDVAGFTEIILLMVFVTTVIAIIGAAVYARMHPGEGGVSHEVASF